MAVYVLILIIFKKTDDVQVNQWILDIAKLQSSEEVEILPTEAKEMINAIKMYSHNYNFYNSRIPANHVLRVVKTPDPEEMLRGDEWALMNEKWTKDLCDHVNSKEVKDFIKAQKKVCNYYASTYVYTKTISTGIYLLKY